VACVAGPNVNRLRSPVFLSCFEFLLNSQWQKSLKILYFQHFSSKTYEINSARQDLSNNIEGTSPISLKFFVLIQFVFQWKVLSILLTFTLPQLSMKPTKLMPPTCRDCCSQIYFWHFHAFTFVLLKSSLNTYTICTWQTMHQWASTVKFCLIFKN